MQEEAHGRANEDPAQQPGHAIEAPAAAQQLGVDPARGLDDAEVRRRLSIYGRNQIRESEREPVWAAFFESLREPMLLLLLGVGVLYLVFGETYEAGTVWAIVLAIAGIEAFQERRAAAAISALHDLAEPQVPVRRDQRVVNVPVAEVVPGDILLLESGRRVASDARLVEAHSLLVDESSLTGESLGVEKNAGVVLPSDVPLAERQNSVFAGTAVLRGKGVALVTTTGKQTELGRIAETIGPGPDEEPTPLQQALRQLAGWLLWIAAAFSIGIPLLGFLTGQPLKGMALTGLALFFASVPEELPVIITLALALGGFWLSRQRAIVRRQRALERIGAVSVIATDKTGTLTENRMAARAFWPQKAKSRLLQIGALCNDAPVDRNGKHGDPLDQALLDAAVADGLDLSALRADHRLIDEYSFDDIRKRMSVTAKHDGQLWVAVKGAPEGLLEISNTVQAEGAVELLTPERRAAIVNALTDMTGSGLRVVAMAEKTSIAATLPVAEAEAGLTFVGLVGMEDPMRPEVPGALASCRSAGIRTVIVSGDHPLTVRAIAYQVGFPADEPLLTGTELQGLTDSEFRDAVRQASVFARVTPEQKLRIVRSLTKDGHRVAVTGDGINDAPALAAAHVGIAMGQGGTEVARQAADIVLTDDSFATLELAIRQGRLLFANIEKGIQYYLACKVALVTSVLAAVVVQAPMPFLPLQIIMMELIMDLAASTGFLAERGDRDVMRRPPRDPRERVLNRRVVTTLVTSALGFMAAVVTAFLVTWLRYDDPARAQTVAFATWLLGHVLMAMTLRSPEPLWRVGVLSNRVIVIWGFFVVLLLVLIGVAPFVQTLTGTVGLSGADWALVVGTAALGTLWREGLKLVTGGRPAKRVATLN